MEPAHAVRFRMQWLLFGGFLLALAAYVGFDAYTSWRNTLEQEQERLLVQARVIDRNLARKLDTTDRALCLLRTSILTDPSYRQVSDHIGDLQTLLPGVRTLATVDAAGRVTVCSRPELVGHDVTAREYFQHARANPDPDLLQISPPYRTVLGVYSINLIRVVVDSGGAFAGIVVATLDPEYFTTLFDSVRYAPDMWVAIAHGDGLQILMVPERPGQAGKDLAQPGSFFSRHRQSGDVENILAGTVYSTGEERLMALRSIVPNSVRADKPLVIAVGRDLKAIYAPWREQFATTAVVFFGISLFAVVLLRRYQRRIRALSREARKAHRLLLDSEQQHRDLVNAIPDLITRVDAEGRFLYVNDVARQVFELGPADCIGLQAFDFVHPDDRAATRAAFADWVSDPAGRVSHINRLRGRHGKVGSFLWNIVIRRGDDGRILDITSVARNIDDLVTMETSLREERDLLEKVFDSSPVVLAVVDPAGRVEQINRAGAILAGRPQGELVRMLGVEIFNCIHAGTPEGCGRGVFCVTCPVRSRVAAVFASGTPCLNEEGH